MARLGRDEVVDGLTEVVRRVNAQGAAASIRIVGGAAMMLRYFADRSLTLDIDASIRTDADLDEIVREVAREHDWPPDWLNDAAAAYIPFAGPGNWHPLYEDEYVTISVATPECLLAMKLKAGRRGRDDEDIAVLLAHLGISTADDAEALFETYYPGELPPDRAYEMLDDIFAIGLPEIFTPPPVEIPRP